MLLLTRPPYLRWLVAGLVVSAAIVWELSDRATTHHPFAASPITRGQLITDDDVAWRQVPRGQLHEVDLTGTYAAVDIASGDPITISVVSSASSIPDGWWSVPVRLPQGAPAGTRVRLTFLDGRAVDGVISLPASEDSFGSSVAGTVAVPEESVTSVATASATDSLIVVIAP